MALPSAARRAALAVASILAVAPLSSGAVGAAPQSDAAAPQDDPRSAWFAASHRRTLWSERARLVLDALSTAAPDVRERAESWMLSARPDGAGANWYPSLELLAGWLRELTGPDAMGPLDPRRGRELLELQAVVDSIDLVVTPAAFAPRSEGRGEPMTAHLRSAYRPTGAGPLEVRLLWIDADGRAQRARTEPGSIEDLRAGFAMFLRPPQSAPGTWRLVPELEQRGVTARGPGLEVDCSAALAQLLEQPDGATAPPVPRVGDAGLLEDWLSGALQVRLTSGARSMLALGPAQALEVLSAGGDPGATRHPRPIGAAWREGDSDEERPLWYWAAPEDLPATRLLVVLGPAHEQPDFVLAGALGERWRAAAQRLGAALVAANAPPSGASRTTAGVVEASIRAAREQGLTDDAEVVVVARGQANARLSWEPIEGVDAFALSTVVRSSDPARYMLGTRRLLVAPGGAAEPGAPRPDAEADADGGAGERGELTWVDGSTVPLLNDLALPGLVEAWLTRD